MLGYTADGWLTKLETSLVSRARTRARATKRSDNPQEKKSVAARGGKRFGFGCADKPQRLDRRPAVQGTRAGHVPGRLKSCVKESKKSKKI